MKMFLKGRSLLAGAIVSVLVVFWRVAHPQTVLSEVVPLLGGGNLKNLTIESVFFPKVRDQLLTAGGREMGVMTEMRSMRRSSKNSGTGGHM
jgi:hypothetical protein